MAIQDQNANPDTINIFVGTPTPKEVPVGDIHIEDLWHIAMHIKEMGMENSGDKILEVWALAHFMKDKLVSIKEGT